MRLLLATDGSTSAEHALQLLLREPWPTASVVRVVAVLDEAAMAAGAPWPVVPAVMPDTLDELARTAAMTTLEGAADRLRPVLAVETAILAGRPAQAIAEEARRWSADVIVMGSRGHGALSTMVLGSVSAEVIDLTDRPVLVARTDRLRGIVLGVDGSAGAERAADLVLRWTPFRSAPIHVVAVAPSAYPWWVGMAEAGGVTTVPELLASEEAVRGEEGEVVQATASRLAAAGFRATCTVREGDAADQLIRAAADTGSDLIVVGTRGRTGLARLVLGSVARNVVTHAPCSVLVVHGPRGPVHASVTDEPAATDTRGEPLAVAGNRHP